MAEEMSSRIDSGARQPGIQRPVNVMEIGKPGTTTQLIIHNGKVWIYNENGQVVIDSGIVQALGIAAGAISTEKLSVSNKAFIQSITWTATDYNTATWSAGSIKWANGTEASVLGGNTGNIVATTYVYYDGTSTLKTTTNIATFSNDNYTLLAIVEIAVATTGRCVITVMSGLGTTINGTVITTGTVQSADGKTVFDLDNQRILLKDASDIPIMLIGKQVGGF